MRTILLLLLTATTLFTQAQQVNGLAKDDNGTALGGATISLIRVTDSAVIKLAVTRPDGSYSFSGIKEGNYKVQASFVGYKTAFSPKFSLGGSDVTVAELKLSKISSNLNNITVTANKPMVEVKADKTILNVEGTINAVGSDALELLRKSPGVLLDKDDNISLAGKNGVQVYIDGRATPLAGRRFG
ncbi:MAG: carboxypeptidase-like regulatory domain-containing protein [Bacteroidota bacterium]